MKNTVHMLKKKIRIAVEQLNTLLKRLDGISHKETNGNEYKKFRDQISHLKSLKESVMGRLHNVIKPNKDPSERSLSKLYEDLTRVEADCRMTLQQHVR